MEGLAALERLLSGGERPAAATGHRGMTEKAQELRGGGPAAATAAASHPSLFYWLPLKHLQSDWDAGGGGRRGGPRAALTLIHSQNTSEHSVNIPLSFKRLPQKSLLCFLDSSSGTSSS